jgi:hypothetical protein
MEGTGDIATDAICVLADNDHQLLFGIRASVHSS